MTRELPAPSIIACRKRGCPLMRKMDGRIELAHINRKDPGLVLTCHINIRTKRGDLSLKGDIVDGKDKFGVGHATGNISEDCSQLPLTPDSDREL